MGVDAAERAVEVGASCDEAIQGLAWNARGRALWEADRYEDARNAFVRAREQATKAKDRDNLVHYEGNIGMCLLELGHPKQARTSVLRAVELAREVGRPALEAIWLVEMARVALAESNWDEAERGANAAIRIAQRGDHWLTIFRATMVKHRAARGRNPIDPDRHNIAYLKRLLGWVEGDASDRDIRDFRKEVLELHGSREAEDA